MTPRSPLVVALARPYIRRRLRRAFDGVRVEGLSAVQELDGPFIVAANHVCWWDALLIFALSAELHVESYGLMDAQNLAQLPFFGWLGAVPLDRSSARASLADMKRVLTRLEATRCAVWVFPQGEHTPAHLRPLRMLPGVEWLAERAGCKVVPLSLSYLYREAPEPTVLASFGRPLPPPTRRQRGTWLASLEEAITDGLHRNDQFVVAGAGAFDELVAPRRPARVPLMGRLLAMAMGAQPLEEGNHHA